MAERRIVTTKTVKTLAKVGDGDPIAGQIKQVLRGHASLTPDGYVSRLKDSMGDTELHVLVFKKMGPAGMSKMGEYMIHELDADDVEQQILGTWGPGLYQMRLVYNKAFYSPSSMPFRVGEEDASTGLATQGSEDVDAMIAQNTKRLGTIAVLKDYKKTIEGTPVPAEDDMKTEQLTQLLVALKPDNTAISSMIDAANRRAEAAEQRNHELTMKMMDMRNTASTGAMPIIGDLLKTVKPEVWQTLLAPQEGTDWLGTIREVVKDLAPTIGPLIQGYMSRAGVPQRALPVHAPRPSGATTEPPPTALNTEGGAGMPMELNEEQQMSKALILEFLKENDMANAYAVLANFPGFVPTPQGPVGMGEYIISRIDPAANPKVYLPQLVMLFPEMKSNIAVAVAFISFVQRKIMADDEAYRRDEQTRGGAQEPGPTRGQEDGGGE